MKKWRCTVCGEIVESDVRPDKCPLCKVPGEKFDPQLKLHCVKGNTQHC